MVPQNTCDLISIFFLIHFEQVQLLNFSCQKSKQQIQSLGNPKTLNYEQTNIYSLQLSTSMLKIFKATLLTFT